MKRRRRSLAKWLGRACGAVAAVMLALWLFYPSLGTLIAASPDGRWGLIASAGWVDVIRASTPSLLVIRLDRWERFELFDKAVARNLVSIDIQSGVPPVDLSIRSIAWQSDRAFAVRPRPPGQRWHPRLMTYYESSGLSIPTWCLAAVPATVFAITESRHRRRTRLERTGRCPACNYDRAGITNDAPCPECGKACLSAGDS